MAVPHLAIPFRLNPDGSAQTVDQDSIDDIAQCVEVLTATTIGSRIELPGYGIPDLTFTQGQPAAQQILQAINTWEPRADATVTTTPGPQAKVNVTVAARTPKGTR